MITRKFTGTTSPVSFTKVMASQSYSLFMFAGMGPWKMENFESLRCIE